MAPLPSQPQRHLDLACLFLILASAWSLPVSQVRHHWGDLSYYNYGWAVPFLTAWLIYQRVPHQRTAPNLSTAWTLTSSALLLVLLLPLHALSEVNPFWRAPLWGQALILFPFSLIAAAHVLGTASLRPLLFPLILLSTMIPWPYRLETLLVQSLTHVVSSLSVDILLFLGFPFELNGNSLRMGPTRIGINEACSGIRSLQALFMMTLFISGVIEASLRGRLLALLLLPGIVLLTNTGRAVFLSLQVVLHGDDAYTRWHDPAGLIAFVASMVLLVGLLLGVSRFLPTPGKVPASSGMTRLPAYRPGPAFLVHLLLPLVAFALVEGWFRLHEWRNPPPPSLAFMPARTATMDWKTLPIHRQISAALGFSYGQRFLFENASMGLCEAYFYGYSSDNKLSSVSSYGHSPLICMEATGSRLVRSFPALTFDAGSNAATEAAPPALTLSHAQFMDPQGRESHVFWETLEANNRGISPEELARLDYFTQWRLLLLGRRDYSRQVLLLNISGALSAESARRYARDVLTASLRQAPADGAHEATTEDVPADESTALRSPQEAMRIPADNGVPPDPAAASAR